MEKIEDEGHVMANLDTDGTIFVGKSSKPEVLTLAFANRHGLVSGATGTGKTVTLQVLAEGLSRAGVSVFAGENQGGNHFSGEPALVLSDFIRTDRDGRGYINILAADKLMSSPRLYATFLLWLLSELFEQLPEVGDQPKPKLCFFFDEAHLLFTDAPKALLDKIEQVVRLVRSKGVGVYFVTQNPLDVPDKVLAQLGNRVQHALRAFTPRDQKAVKAAAETFRPNPKLDTAKVIMELGKGEALVSFLEGNGTPSMVERCMIRPPSGRVGPISEDERKALMAGSPVKGKYDQAIDRESAYEILQKRMQDGTDAGPSDGSPSPGETAQASAAGGFAGVMAWITEIVHSIFGTGHGRRTRLTRGQKIARQVTRSVSNQIAGKIAADIGKSIGGKAGSSVGRAIGRGTMGG